MKKIGDLLQNDFGTLSQKTGLKHTKSGCSFPGEEWMTMLRPDSSVENPAGPVPG